MSEKILEKLVEIFAIGTVTGIIPMLAQIIVYKIFGL